MIRAALVQAQDPRRPGDEERALIEVLSQRGVSVSTFTRKQLQRRALPLAAETLVAGEVDVVRAALRQLGIEGPFLPTYPRALRAWLGRRVAETTLGQVLARDDLPLFVKPAAREKRFTGIVFGGSSDVFRFAGASRSLAVWVSEVVRFTAEHRVYVVHGEPRATCCYAGDEAPPPEALAGELIEALRASGELVAGFAIDLGRLDDGRWALVECNDGFGLGRYPDCPREVYADLVAARWIEITGPFPSPNRRTT